MKTARKAVRLAPVGLQTADPVSRARMRAIVEGAATAFCHYGFARTQMADIAAEAGVALGTLYRFATSKDALFQMALLAGVGASDQEIADAGAGERDLFRFIEDHLVKRLNAVAELEAAVPSRAPSAEAVREFFALLYDVVERVHQPLRMLDRSAREWPELAVLFNAELRAPTLRAVERFLTRMNTRRGAPTPSIAAKARLIVETTAWFAMHRRYTPDAPDITDQEARQTVLDFVAAALRPAA